MRVSTRRSIVVYDKWLLLILLSPCWLGQVNALAQPSRGGGRKSTSHTAKTSRRTRSASSRTNNKASSTGTLPTSEKSWTVSSNRKIHHFATHCTIPPLQPIPEQSFLPANGTVDHNPYLDPLPLLVDTTNHRFLPVTYTNQPQTLSTWLSNHLSSNGPTVLGFDVESVVYGCLGNSGRCYGPATVQLSTLDACIVVQLTRVNRRPSDDCRSLLQAVVQDSQIIKAGCGLDDDMVDLRELWTGLEASSRLDLCGLVGVKNPKQPQQQLFGLKKLTKHILGYDLPKPNRISRSDWSRFPLSGAQIEYSARDAWVGAAIVNRLEQLDPETFSADNLIRRLESQPSIAKLAQRRTAVRQAKGELKSLNEEYRRRREKECNAPPPHRKRARLQEIIKRNRKTSFEFFEVDPLTSVSHKKQN